MTSRLRWVIASFLACAVAGWASGEGACAKDRQPESGAPLQTILELETTARLLAVLLDSGRNVINEHQVLFDEQEKTEKILHLTCLSDNYWTSFAVARYRPARS